jgi:hypothetical protein
MLSYIKRLDTFSAEALEFWYSNKKEAQFFNILKNFSNKLRLGFVFLRMYVLQDYSAKVSFQALMGGAEEM